MNPKTVIFLDMLFSNPDAKEIIHSKGGAKRLGFLIAYDIHFTGAAKDESGISTPEEYLDLLVEIKSRLSALGLSWAEFVEGVVLGQSGEWGMVINAEGADYIRTPPQLSRK